MIFLTFGSLRAFWQDQKEKQTTLGILCLNLTIYFRQMLRHEHHVSNNFNTIPGEP